MYLNKAIIIGNLTRDPEQKALPSGMAVTNFALATNRMWKDNNGEKKEETEYHNVVVFGKQAETVATYLKKGQSALVEGRIQTRSWETDGVKKYRTEIVAERVQFGPKSASSEKKAPKSTEDTSNDIEYTQDEINPEDIPF